MNGESQAWFGVLCLLCRALEPPETAAGHRAETAMDLRDVVTGQREEIEQLQKCRTASAGLGEEPGSLPDDVRFEHSYAAQQQVTSDLQRLMLSLQEDQHHPAYDLVLARLSTTQRQLGALRVAHDLALRHQVLNALPAAMSAEEAWCIHASPAVC